MDYLSVAEFADHVGVSKSTIFCQIKQGKIKAHKVGRQYWIDIIELMFFERNENV